MGHVDAGRAPVDFSRIRETSEGDLEFERDLFQVFLEDCAERIERLAQAMAHGDGDGVRLEAHTVKGAGGNVGTTSLHEIAARLERCAGDSLAESGPALLAELEAEFARAKRAILTYLDAL